ncbi:hypothetical protein KOJCDNHJ_02849 [Xanthomonas citri pv. punicae]|nr:hypothetical protein KOJCDNHJ_02849 [Xanthomonas citri pv. punicae]
MVKQQRCHQLPRLTIFGNEQTQQRRAVQRQAIAAWIIDRTLLACDVALRRIERDRLDWQPGATCDHLHRLRQSLPDDRGAQNGVAIDHLLQCLDEGLEPGAIGEAELRTQ